MIVFNELCVVVNERKMETHGSNRPQVLDLRISEQGSAIMYFLLVTFPESKKNSTDNCHVTKPNREII
jgi:hypothetical protein